MHTSAISHKPIDEQQQNLVLHKDSSCCLICRSSRPQLWRLTSDAQRPLSIHNGHGRAHRMAAHREGDNGAAGQAEASRYDGSLAPGIAPDGVMGIFRHIMVRATRTCCQVGRLFPNAFLTAIPAKWPLERRCFQRPQDERKHSPRTLRPTQENHCRRGRCIRGSLERATQG